MKSLLILLLLFSSLYSYTYNTQIMQIYAKIAPRLVLMTTGQKPLANKSILIGILYAEGDRKAAKKLAKLMHNAYPKGLEHSLLDIRLFTYKDVAALQNISLLFFLENSPNVIEPILNFAKQKQILSIVYDNRLLAKGAMVSLYIGKTVKPYLNLKAVQQSGLSSDNVLMSISKIYYNDEEQ